jgi:hypothetical protein
MASVPGETTPNLFGLLRGELAVLYLAAQFRLVSPNRFLVGARR